MAESRKSPEKVTENRKSPSKNKRKAGNGKNSCEKGEEKAAENRKRQRKAAENRKRTPYNRPSVCCAAESIASQQTSRDMNHLLVWILIQSLTDGHKMMYVIPPCICTSMLEKKRRLLRQYPTKRDPFPLAIHLRGRPLMIGLFKSCEQLFILRKFIFGDSGRSMM